MNRVTIEAPSRLHFGLLGWGPQSPRQFGGVGLMIAGPGLEVVVETAAEWSAAGPLAARALEIGKSVAAQRPGTGPARIEVVRVPPEHVGLGVGTQLSMAVAQGLVLASGGDALAPNELARLTRRGQRSGIGVHGFVRGGLIIDAGPKAPGEVPTLLVGTPFPPGWSILLVVPKDHVGLHGPEEVRAFQRLRDGPAVDTDRLCALLLLQILPAVLERDLPTFGEALSEFQRVVGRGFAPVQGGSFAGAATERRLEAMRAAGLVGVGQSSWGPVLYGFTSDATAQGQAESELETSLGDGLTYLWTRASKAGALFQVG